MPPKAKSAAPKDSTATIGFEAKLWLAADKLRNNMDAAEYTHVVLGLIFFKYISDTFEKHRAKLLAEEGDYAGANPEDRDEYKAENVFWVPANARWSHLNVNAKQPTIGKTVDDASPKGRAGALINISSPASPAPRARTAANSTPRPASSAASSRCSRPTRAASTTPPAPPAAVCLRASYAECAIAQSVVQSEKFAESHSEKLGKISIYGQDKWARRQRPFGLAKRARRVRLRGQQPKQSNATTRSLAVTS